jgi:hypothetical protein
MRTVFVAAAALATGFVVSAVAQQAGHDAHSSNQSASSSNQKTGGCAPTAMGNHASNSMSQGGFTHVEPVATALIVRAIDPDGNPVTMLITPASQ